MGIWMVDVKGLNEMWRIDADDLVQQAQSHVLRASKSCKDVSEIKSLAANKGNVDVHLLRKRNKH